MPPAHASHILQPLDIGCFSVSKKAYGGLIGEEMRNGVNSIDKDDTFRSTLSQEMLRLKLLLYKIVLEVLV